MTDTIQISRDLANQLIDDLISLIDYEWHENHCKPRKQKGAIDDIQSRIDALKKAMEQEQ